MTHLPLFVMFHDSFPYSTVNSPHGRSLLPLCHSGDLIENLDKMLPNFMDMYFYI